MKGEYFSYIEDEIRNSDTTKVFAAFSSAAEMERVVWNGIKTLVYVKNDKSGIISFHYNNEIRTDPHNFPFVSATLSDHHIFWFSTHFDYLFISIFITKVGLLIVSRGITLQIWLSTGLLWSQVFRKRRRRSNQRRKNEVSLVSKVWFSLAVTDSWWVMTLFGLQHVQHNMNFSQEDMRTSVQGRKHWESERSERMYRWAGL